LRGGRGGSLAGFADDFDLEGDVGAVLKGVDGRPGTLAEALHVWRTHRQEWRRRRRAGWRKGRRRRWRLGGCGFGVRAFLTSLRYKKEELAAAGAPINKSASGVPASQGSSGANTHPGTTPMGSATAATITADEWDAFWMAIEEAAHARPVAQSRAHVGAPGATPGP
jgi:hypothetical protein